MSYPFRYKKYCRYKAPELRKAIQCIVEGDSFNKAYKKTGVSPATIKKFYSMYVNKPILFMRRTKAANNVSTAVKNDTEITVFTPEQETALEQCLKEFEYLFYGLTEKECRMLAYQMVINDDMKIPVDWKHGMASITWLMSFQFILNLEKPDLLCTRKKVQRAQAVSDRNLIWEKKSVTSFYDDLEKSIQKYPELKNNQRIYSLDEAYTSIDPEKNSVDRESKTDLLTTCCFICADGTSLPPVIVKPHALYGVCSDVPPGVVVLTGSRGRMTPDMFTEVMHHFVKLSNSSLSNPSILIMDTDLCHLSYAAINLAKESGVHVLTVHSHVSILVQPLLGDLFDSFYKCYYDLKESWWINHDDTADSSLCDFGKFVSEAYSKVMISENIKNSFKKCGINPFDRDLFTDTDYLSCLHDVNYTCYECKIRDDRSRKLLENSAAGDDEAKRGFKSDPQVEELKEKKEKSADEKELGKIHEPKVENENTCSDSDMEVDADVYQHQQQMQRNIQSQTRPYSNAERQRRYREKRKADKMNTFSQSSDVQPQQEQPQHDVQINISNKRRPQSSAERQRKYRKLLREQQQQQMEDINAITVLTNTPHTSSIDQLQNVDQAEYARKRLLNKQRQSRFRARQRFESPSTSSHQAQAESTKMACRTQSSQELDKLKRRLIRSVARLIKEKKTEDEVWAELKKECGQNCKKLWVRMRSLTLKKLKRLFDADDCADFVPAVARMTLTDWLLYDLVLVHEKIDVINSNSDVENKVLNNLFSLVQRFQVEGRSGDDLAEAWTAATVSYNSKGHQCSPMLMQRRWFQVKEQTREKLYKFWFKYRGNERLLGVAKQDPPTQLQRSIALRYPEIITQHFLSWEERVEKNLVIMPAEFEIKMRKKELMKPSDEKIPDVEIVEQKIDTITVDSDSDFNDVDNDEFVQHQNATDNNETSQTPIIVQVKSEPIDPYDNIDITEHPIYPEKPRDRFQDAIERLEIEEDRIAMSQLTEDCETSQDYVMPLITNVKGAVEETINDQDISMRNNALEIYLENPTQVINTTESTISDIIRPDKELNNVLDTLDNSSQNSILIEDDDDIRSTEDVVQNRSNTPEMNQIASNVIDITSPAAEQNTDNNYRMPLLSQNVYTVPVENPTYSNKAVPITPAVTSGTPKDIMELNTADKEMSKDFQDSEDLMEDIIQLVPEKKSYSHIGMEESQPVTNFSEGFSFADDGIECDEELYQSEVKEALTPQKQGAADENGSTPKFDLKLLMNPVIYTTKLDDMKAYIGKSLSDTISEKHLVDAIIIESKPVSEKSIKVEQIKPDLVDVQELDNIDQVKVENLVNFENDLFQNDSSNDSEPIETLNRVKLSSFMLQKPRSRTYNPIQLCKNPDFNTRLKRLPISFFSSSRNRVFLKACKPMTIDLSKAFESKLINGTIYLKPSDPTVSNDTEDVSETSASIMPSAVAVQSLMDNTDVDKILQDELRKRIIERNKTIQLPNISLVRQINQNLLIAEVSPMVTQAETSTHEQITDVINTTPEVMNVPNTALTNVLSTNRETTNVFNSNSIIPSNSVPLLNKQTAPVIISEIPIKETVFNNLLPMMNNDKVDKTPENSRKKHEKPITNKPFWLSHATKADLRPYTESLLTIDTLYKVLNALDPTSINYTPKTKSKTKSKLRRPADSISKDMENTTNEKGQQQTNSFDTDSAKITSSTTDNAKKVRAKSNIPKKPRICCWARSRINIINGLSNVPDNKHKCSATYCRCCCKEILRQTEINHEIKLLEQMQNRDSFDETIERVVQQSRSVVIQPLTKLNFPIKNPNKSGDLSNVAMSSISHNQKIPQLPPQRVTKESRTSVGTQASLSDQHNVTDSNEPENESTLDTSTVKEIQNETGVTINLDDDEDEISPSDEQTPRPKIRVHAATPNVSQSKSQKASVGKKNQTKNTAMPPLEPLDAAPPIVLPELPLYLKSRISKIRPKPNGNKTIVTMSKPSLEESGEDVLPCTCRPNVAIDKLSATIVVDGSNQCSRHTKSHVSKETRIYLNRKHMSASARPFFVGKNKILLTNVTRKAPPPPTPPLAPSETKELPAGVQVVLLADGTISYLVDAEVKLTHEQMFAMPQILAAIQQQIKASGVTLPDFHNSQDSMSDSSTLNAKPKSADFTSDVQHGSNNINNPNEEEKSTQAPILLSENKDNSSLDTSYPESKKEVIQESQIMTNNISEKASEPPKTANQQTLTGVSIDTEVVKNTDNVDEQSLSKDTLIDKKNTDIGVGENENSSCSELSLNTDNTVLETVHRTSKDVKKNEPIQTSENKTTSAENNDNATTTSSRNLLSDLMEMSGINEEDIVLPQQHPTNTSLESTQPLLVDTSHFSEARVEPIPAPPLSPSAENHSISAQINEKIYKLTPVTSFADLKYACDNNGLFFKLDLNTGLIVPINVCIQKTSESAAFKNISSSEVIDLTDDQTSTEQPSSNEHATLASNEIFPQKIKLKDLSSMVQKRSRGIPLKNVNILLDGPNQNYKLDIKDIDEEETTSKPLHTHEMQKRRGRPQKNIKSVLIDNLYEVYEEESSSDVSLLARKKRPRGRPHKNTNSILIDNEDESEDEESLLELSSTIMPKRPRGRPRKTTLIMLNLNQAEEEQERSQTVLNEPIPTSLIEKKAALIKRLSNNLKPLRMLQEKRIAVNILKRNLQLPSHTPIGKKIANLTSKAHVNINLEDSDAPMEEEYLSDFGDDSDDEPLAQIAKKMRPNESTVQNDAQVSRRVSQSNENDDDHLDFEDVINAISAVEPPVSQEASMQDETAPEPVPTQLVLSGAALDKPLPDEMNNSLNFIASESIDEDSGDDCILGF